MQIFLSIIISIGLSYLQWYMTKDGEKQKNKPPSKDDFSSPLANENTAIGKGWGTFLVKGWMVLNWNKTRSERVVEKVKSIWGTTKQETPNFKHYGDVHAGICLTDNGHFAQLIEIRLDDKVVWTNPNPEAGDVINGYINQPDFYGEDTGISGSFDFHSGKDDQDINSYLNQASLYNGYASAWPKLAHVVFKNFWFATSSGPTSVPSFQFVIRHVPVPSWSESSTIILNGDINPIAIVHYILSDDLAGAEIPPELLDFNSFQTAAVHCKNEGIFVDHWNQQSVIAIEEITNILEVADATIYTDLLDGLVKIALLSAPYEKEDLTHLQMKQIKQYQWSRNSISEQVSEVRISYTDRSENYKTLTEPFRNEATRIRKGKTSVKTINYPMVPNRELASKLATREGIPLTTSMLQLSLETTRVLSTHRIGDAVRATIPELGVNDMVFRVTKINYGKLKASSITVDLMQDKFGEFRRLTNSSDAQIIPDRNADALNANLQVITAPKYFNINKEVAVDNLVLAFAEKPSNRHLYFNLYTDSTTTTDYILNGQSTGFAPLGQLSAALTPTNSSFTVNSTDFVQVNDQLDALSGGKNLAVIMEGSKIEFINFGVSTTSSSSSYLIQEVNRGLFDTIPKSFTTAARVYVISLGCCINDTDFFLNNEAVKFKALTVTDTNTLLLPDASTVNYTVTNRKDLPIVVSNLKVNNVNFNTSQTITGDLKLNWSFRNGIGTIQYFSDQVNSNVDDVTVNIQIYNGATLLKTFTSNSVNEYVFTDEKDMNGGNYYSNLTVKIKTTKGALESVDQYDLIINR